MVTVQVSSGARPAVDGPARALLPTISALARQAVPRLLEGVVIPLALFYAALNLFGLNGALLAVLTWVYGNAAARLLLRRAISATMILALLAITARSALAWWSGSAIVYFLQPELGTICISVAFVVSVWLRRPLVGKLIRDYIHLPTRVVRHARMQRCFARLTLLWAAILLLNAGMSIWLLLSQTIEIYLLVRPLAVAGTCGLAFIGSVWIFLRLLRHLAHQSGQPPVPRSPAAAGAH